MTIWALPYQEINEEIIRTTAGRHGFAVCVIHWQAVSDFQSYIRREIGREATPGEMAEIAQYAANSLQDTAVNDELEYHVEQFVFEKQEEMLHEVP
ncbi:MAG: hypothetical protein ABIH46_13995 [Chloroflexota bacterium]